MIKYFELPDVPKYFITSDTVFGGDISELLRLKRSEYHRIMVRDFNAKLHLKYKICNEETEEYCLENNLVFFDDKKDIEKAIEWVESMLLMRKLNEIQNESIEI